MKLSKLKQTTQKQDLLGDYPPVGLEAVISFQGEFPSIDQLFPDNSLKNISDMTYAHALKINRYKYNNI